MAKKKAGRPPLAGKKMGDKMLIECQPAQKAKWNKAAAKLKMSLSQWVRKALDDKAAG